MLSAASPLEGVSSLVSLACHWLAHWHDTRDKTPTDVYGRMAFRYLE